jgi:hypothetical protein
LPSLGAVGARERLVCPALPRRGSWSRLLGWWSEDSGGWSGRDGVQGLPVPRAQGLWVGMCRTSRHPVVASDDPGAQTRPAALVRSAATAVAHAMLKAITAQATQAPHHPRGPWVCQAGRRLRLLQWCGSERPAGHDLHAAGRAGDRPRAAAPREGDPLNAGHVPALVHPRKRGTAGRDHQYSPRQPTSRRPRWPSSPSRSTTPHPPGVEQVMKAGRLGQRQHGAPDPRPNRARIIEHRTDGMKRLHSRGVPLASDRDVAIPTLPAQSGPRVLRHAHPDHTHR